MLVIYSCRDGSLKFGWRGKSIYTQFSLHGQLPEFTQYTKTKQVIYIFYATYSVKVSVTICLSSLPLENKCYPLKEEPRRIINTSLPSAHISGNISASKRVGLLGLPLFDNNDYGFLTCEYNYGIKWLRVAEFTLKKF